MTKKRRSNERKRRRPAHAGPPAARKPAGEGYRGREIWRDVLKGVLFFALVLAIKLSAEHTDFGKQLRVMSYNVLQTHLSSQPVPITVVDISDLPPKDYIVHGQTVTATPREPLKEMIQAIADQQPRAIGIDIDFSPDENGILPSDPEFFQFCLDLSKQRGLSIFLGIKRTMTTPPAEWLGTAKYQDLAANILIPKDNKRMLNLLRVEAGHGPEETSKPSRAISALLADAYGQEPGALALGQRLHKPITNWLVTARLIEKFSEKQLGSGLSAEDFLVDYSPLESIETNTIKAADLGNPDQRERLQGRVVLIGDATLGKATDTFVVPARDQPYPGVFLHACGTYTLIKAPLYELTGMGHVVLDVLLSGAILAGIVLISLRYKDQEEREAAAHRWQGLFTLLIVLMAIIIGVVFVRITRIMWDDFFLALTLLILHPSIERHTENFWQRMRNLLFPGSRGVTTRRKEHH